MDLCLFKMVLPCMEPGHIARCAQLAMLLEVSATPKPGNIDRDHDYSDTCFEHFLSSAVGVYPVLEKAARSESGVGSLIHEAVIESNAWQKGGNTHFGAFILLIPLVMAAGKCGTEKSLKELAEQVVRETTVKDAVEFYRAFSRANVKVKPVKDLDLRDISSSDRIQQQGLTLYNILEISSGYDTISDEWTGGFRRTFECASSIQDKLKTYSINDAVVLTFLELLSRSTDTFIQTKFDGRKAEEISMRAKQILQKGELSKIMDDIRAFDEELLREGINPGSTADIIIAGLFVLLLQGMRF